MMTKPLSLTVLFTTTLLLAAGLVQAQPTATPDAATQVPLERGVKPPRTGASGPLAGDFKPRTRLELKPRMKSDELKPALHFEPRPEMSPGMQPNSQKPLRTETTPPRSDSSTN